MKDEAERLAARLPQGAHIVLLDARGKGMTSEDFAEMLGSLRDVGTKDLAFVIGGLMVWPRCRAKRRAAAWPSGPRPGASSGPRAAHRAGLSGTDHPGGHPYHRA
jgi:23S rRNA (pseudouridine1915-N3)-methyltransferase